MYLTPHETDHDAFRSHSSLIEATATGSPIIWELKAPDGMEFASVCLRVLSFIRRNPGATRTTLCRSFGRLYNTQVTDSLLSTGFISEQTVTAPNAKKPTKKFFATQAGIRIVK